MENERRSGVDRRQHQRRKQSEDFARMCREINDKNIEIKRLSDEIREINKGHHD